jgi:hypothetical protein
MMIVLALQRGGSAIVDDLDAAVANFMICDFHNHTPLAILLSKSGGHSNEDPKNGVRIEH